MLADSDQERNKWVGLLSELHRILKKNKLKERFVYAPKEAYDSTLPLIKTTQSATIIGRHDHARTRVHAHTHTRIMYVGDAVHSMISIDPESMLIYCKLIGRIGRNAPTLMPPQNGGIIVMWLHGLQALYLVTILYCIHNKRSVICSFGQYYIYRH